MDLSLGDRHSDLKDTRHERQPHVQQLPLRLQAHSGEGFCTCSGVLRREELCEGKQRSARHAPLTRLNRMTDARATSRSSQARIVALADGGIETALDERLGQKLPEFAAFTLLDTELGRTALTEYYRPFIELAAGAGMPLVLDTPTWRANPDWGAALGYSAEALSQVNASAARLARETAEHLAPDLELTVSGCIGPRYDDDDGDEHTMAPSEAERYHDGQVRALAAAGVDRVTAVTMSDPGEAQGIVRAARAAGVPVAVSFAVGADGLLPGGASLGRAILETDELTDAYALGYLVNCAHPDEAALGLNQTRASEAEKRAINERIIGFRLNAAHHGADGPGDAPDRFAHATLALRSLAPGAQVFGGCCGTDAPHIAAIADALTVEVASAVE